MTELKYKLIRAGKKELNNGSGSKRRFFQVQALRDIPAHGVKAGDLGGYVTRKDSLAHEGDCWIGGEAQAIGYVSIEGNAYIGGKAYLHSPVSAQCIYIEDNAKIYENAKLLYDFASNNDVFIKGNAKIHGNARLAGVLEVSDDVEIYGDASIKAGVRILGNSKIHENAVLEKNSRVIDTVVNGLAEIGEGDRIRNGKLDTSGINSADSDIQKFHDLEEYVKGQQVYIKELEVERDSFASKVFETEDKISRPTQNSETLDFFNEITANIDSYAADIVKIIKYPAMVDPSVPETLAMTVALKKARRLSKKPESEEFATAVAELEEKFIRAEAQAFKLASTLLSDEDKKKTRKASDLFRVASNEASSEQEKKVAFIQGFKQLEGVIPVPEVAVDTFRIKIGLKELETLSSLEEA